MDGLGVDRVEALGVAGRAEGEQRQGLRLATREQRRAVRAGHEAHFAGDRPDLGGGAAVGTPLVDGDAAPDDVFFELREGALDLGGALAHVGFVDARGEGLDDARAQLDRGVLAGLLLFDRGDAVDVGAVGAHDLVVEGAVDFDDRHVPLGLAGELAQAQLRVDQLLDLGVGDAQALEDLRPRWPRWRRLRP